MKKGFNPIPLLKFTIHRTFGKEANDFHNEIYFLWNLVVISCALQGAFFPPLWCFWQLLVERSCPKNPPPSFFLRSRQRQKIEQEILWYFLTHCFRLTSWLWHLKGINLWLEATLFSERYEGMHALKHFFCKSKREKIYLNFEISC